jgi:hypothetical protein
MNIRIAQWQGRIHRIKEELVRLGDMRPGALSEQYNVCGTAGCRCKDPTAPKRHGPYYQLSYSHKGKSTTEFVKKPMLPDVRKQLRNFAKFRKLTDEWVALSLKISSARRKLAKRSTR